MVAFVEKTLGLPADIPEPGMAGFDLLDGTLFEVFGPAHHGGGRPPSCLVAGFGVDDIAGAYRSC
jgi:hypothetical protein